jgi:hypothetical protein
VAPMREEEKLYKVLVGNTKERNHSEDRGVDGVGIITLYYSK